MDNEFRQQLKANFRKEVFEVLELISSREEQLAYQHKVPIAYVSAELFNQWEDCYQILKVQEWYSEAFSEIELLILKEFDRDLEVIAKSTPQNPPEIHEFIKTKEWEQLAIAAKNTLDKLKGIQQSQQ